MEGLPILLLGLATFAVALNVQEINNAFSPNIYAKLYQNSEPNYLFGTLSVFTGLSMLLSGSDGKTKSEILKTLNVSSVDDLETGMKTLMRIMSGDNKYILNLANGMYIDNDYSVKDSYIEKMEDVYQASINNKLHFENPKAVAADINTWIQNKTNNAIENIIYSTEISHTTKAILLNALHFNANWSSQFDTKNTDLALFFPHSGHQVTVKTMTKSITCRYAENKDLDATFLELPFVGKDSLIVFVLPKQTNGIDDLEKEIHKVLGPQNFNTRHVKIHLPKFKLEQTIDLKGALAKLGVTAVFDPVKADLSGIVGKPGEMHLDRFREKVSINLNEHGVDAASGGDVLLDIPVILGEAPIEETFKANHPFLYYIKIREVIAFVGRVRDPSK